MNNYAWSLQIRYCEVLLYPNPISGYWIWYPTRYPSIRRYPTTCKLSVFCPPVCLYICLFICLSVCPTVCLYICRSLSMYVCHANTHTNNTAYNTHNTHTQHTYTHARTHKHTYPGSLAVDSIPSATSQRRWTLTSIPALPSIWMKDRVRITTMAAMTTADAARCGDSGRYN